MAQNDQKDELSKHFRLEHPRVESHVHGHLRARLLHAQRQLREPLLVAVLAIDVPQHRGQQRQDVLRRLAARQDAPPPVSKEI